MSKQTLKKGDQVVMHTCMEHDHPDNFGKIWTCRSDEFQHKGHDYGSVFLEGFSGSFSTEYLQLVDLPGVIKRLKEENTRLQQSQDDWKKHAYDMSHDIGRLEGKLQDALNTLKWYADDENHKQERVPYDEDSALDFYYEPSNVHDDEGKRAKQAIDRIQMEQSGGTGE